MSRIALTLKAARELGLRRSLAYLQYQAGKRSGWYRLRVRPPRGNVHSRLMLPDFDPLAVEEVPSERIDALLAGTTVIFGALPASLDFSPPGPIGHWTLHETARLAGQDVKFLWEPARFCWTADLVRAYRRVSDERLPAFFAGRLAEFMRLNPPYRGPHWTSGQEVALRLIHLSLAAAVLGAPQGFAAAAAVHAARLPPTLAYARAQGNNHLLSESAGLLTAGTILPDHPEALRWRTSGLAWFERGLLEQIGPDGIYMQQSANYHRLVLQLALWCRFLLQRSGATFSALVVERLAAATRWLLERCDPASGAVPNLGPNDGAYILPLTNCPFADYRPVLQAAARAFLSQDAFEPGPWDEMSSWLGADPPRMRPPETAGFNPQAGPGVLHHPDLSARAFLRAAHFTQRPGHADQLHVDLWWQGRNIALDPGTYLYNGQAPWDNPLQSAFHHNTITIDGLDQMTPAGRFLYVDKAQARFLPSGPGSMCAEHDGYRRLGVTHRRTLTALTVGWQVDDRILGAGRRDVRLHWLLPDWPWELDGARLGLLGPAGRVELSVGFAAGLESRVDLARAGEGLAGRTPRPTMGWFSPTYGVRLPALSFSVSVAGELPLALKSTWTLITD